MRWLSSFALLLYFCILCTPQAFAVHDTRLSPLADKQFHAVTPQHICTADNGQAEANDDPQPELMATNHKAVTSVFCGLLNQVAHSFAAQPISGVNARGPPIALS